MFYNVKTLKVSMSLCNIFPTKSYLPESFKRANYNTNAFLTDISVCLVIPWGIVRQKESIFDNVHSQILLQLKLIYNHHSNVVYYDDTNN